MKHDCGMKRTEDTARTLVQILIMPEGDFGGQASTII